MSVLCNKGEGLALTKSHPQLRKIVIRIGWDSILYTGDEDFDLDTAVFLLDENGQVEDENDLIFYNNPISVDGGVVHTGDEEEVKIDLTRISATVHKLVFVITIYDALLRQQHFGQGKKLFISICDDVTGTELVQYNVEEKFTTETAIIGIELKRQEREWEIKALGTGIVGGLTELCTQFGLGLEEKEESDLDFMW